jgi:hypothetical protein
MNKFISATGIEPVFPVSKTGVLTIVRSAQYN